MPKVDGINNLLHQHNANTAAVLVANSNASISGITDKAGVLRMHLLVKSAM